MSVRPLIQVPAFGVLLALIAPSTGLAQEHATSAGQPDGIAPAVQFSAADSVPDPTPRRSTAWMLAFGGLCAILGAAAGIAACQVLPGRLNKRTRAAAASLEASRQHLLYILRETSLGYIEWDLDFRVLSWSKTAEKIFGYTEEAAIGKSAFELVVPPELDGRISELWRAIVAGEITDNLNENVCADGARIQCQWNNTVIRDSTGKAVSVASLVKDVTDSMRNQETMRMAVEEAQKATRAKSEFLANMSHEIRTPMNGVIGLTELLLESDLDPQQRSYLEVIRSSGEMLITIINDILDLSKIESGMLSLHERDFNLEECLRSAFHLFGQQLGSKGLASEIDLDPSLPAHAHGDPVRLRQIIYNLVSNAVKFTESGKISLQARAEAVTSMRTRLHVTIADTGCGIDPGRLESVFEPFNQADTSSTRAVGGTGLGLTICKRLCRLMRGDIRVESSSSQGTRFSFFVELQCANQVDGDPQAARLAPANNHPGEGGGKGLHVLVVEDNAVNRLVTKRILNRLGHHCATVTNGQEAVNFVQSNPCELILMDLQMPVMDGFAATRIIRERMGTGIPIIALTASAVQGDRERCLEYGMDDYLSKPVHIEAIEQAIANCRHRARQ